MPGATRASPTGSGCVWRLVWWHCLWFWRWRDLRWWRPCLGTRARRTLLMRRTPGGWSPGCLDRSPSVFLVRSASVDRPRALPALLARAAAVSDAAAGLVLGPSGRGLNSVGGVLDFGILICRRRLCWAESARLWVRSALFRVAGRRKKANERVELFPGVRVLLLALALRRPTKVGWDGGGGGAHPVLPSICQTSERQVHEHFGRALPASGSFSGLMLGRVRDARAGGVR